MNSRMHAIIQQKNSLMHNKCRFKPKSMFKSFHLDNWMKVTFRWNMLKQVSIYFESLLMFFFFSKTDKGNQLIVYLPFPRTYENNDRVMNAYHKHPRDKYKEAIQMK